MRASNRAIVENNGALRAKLHLGFQKPSLGVDQVPTVSSHHPSESISNAALNCELQIDGTATLACSVEDLMSVLREEFGAPCEGVTLDFGREGWTLETQFSSPANLKMILDAIDRVIQRKSISAADVAIVLDDESHSLTELLRDDYLHFA